MVAAMQPDNAVMQDLMCGVVEAAMLSTAAMGGLADVMQGWSDAVLSMI